MNAGSSILCAQLREKFWIIRAKRLVKQDLSECVICKRYKAKHVEVPFAPLPRERVPQTKIFEVTGVDYAGPLYLKSKAKVYPGKDGVPRVARIRTCHGERIGPFQRLYPLEVSAETEIGVLKASGKDSLPVEKTTESSTNHVLDSPTDYVPDFPAESTDNSEEKPSTKTRLGRTIKIPPKLDL
ncbi:integrase_H2C2 domain-containing protein [Trichonephila clavipes]|nr:integrase_H2C2 domain-containing protein [Trichonephila clavipes]